MSERMKYKIETLAANLMISEGQLAAMLGISPRTLEAWKQKSLENMKSEKESRLLRLIQVAKYLTNRNNNGSQVCNIINNGRVETDGTDDDNSISLISYICAAPHDLGWMANASSAEWDCYANDPVEPSYCPHEGEDDEI